MRFQESDIPALDFILSELVKGRTPVTLSGLEHAGFLPREGRGNTAIFKGYAEALAYYGCCEINTKTRGMWGLLSGGKAVAVQRDGGFQAIYKAEMQSLEKGAKRYALEGKALEDSIEHNKKTRQRANIALCLSAIAILIEVIDRWLNC